MIIVFIGRFSIVQITRFANASAPCNFCISNWRTTVRLCKRHAGESNHSRDFNQKALTGERQTGIPSFWAKMFAIQLVSIDLHLRRLFDGQWIFFLSKWLDDDLRSNRAENQLVLQFISFYELVQNLQFGIRCQCLRAKKNSLFTFVSDWLTSIVRIIRAHSPASLHEYP